MLPYEPPPIPKDFGWRYVLWSSWFYFWRGLYITISYLWVNAITVLSTVSAFFTAITLDPTLVARTTLHYILIVNFSLTAILAQIDRSKQKPLTPKEITP
jgi:hypothetical protein